MKLGDTLTGLAVGLAISLAGPAVAEKTLTVAHQSATSTLDPARAGNEAEYAYLQAVYNSLTFINWDMQPEPELAESWEVSEDGTSVTFHLKSGVKFHDGSDLDAEDVVYTIKRLQDPETGSRVRSQLEVIQDVVAVDPLTVRFDLQFPYGDLPTVLGDYTLRILPKDYTDFAKPVGTGPFIMEEFAPGDRMILKKNPDYWEAGLPKVDEMVFRNLPEMTTMVSALESGTVQMIGLDPESVDIVKGSSSAHVETVASGTWMAYVFNNQIPPFNDIRVRQAFDALIDREEVLAISAFGAGVPTLTTIPPTSAYYLKDYTPPKPDIAKAKALLAEAGIAEGTKMTINYPSASSEQERMALVLRDKAKEIGIDIELAGHPNDKFYGEIEGTQPLATTLFYGRPTPDTQTYLWYISEGSYNIWDYANPETDEILNNARLAKTDEERKGLYQDLQRKVLEDVPGIVLYVRAINYGVDNKVEGFKPHPRSWVIYKQLSVAD